MKTELVNNIAKETIYQLQYPKSLNLAHKKITKLLLIFFSTIFFCLILNHDYYYLNFGCIPNALINS